MGAACRCTPLARAGQNRLVLLPRKGESRRRKAMSKGKSGLGKWLALFIIARVGAASGAEVGLTENARAEIAALLKEKASWTAAKNKMDSQLIQASKKHRGQAFAPGAGHLQIDRKSTRLNSSHIPLSRMPSSA